MDASKYSNGYLADELGDTWSIFDDEVRPIMGHYTFDGEGNKLTFNPSYTSATLFNAPFRYAEDATFENLHIDGTITSPCAAAGLVGTVKGNTTVRNCRNSITIDCTATGGFFEGAFYGGFICNVASGKTVFTGCVFDGRSLDFRFFVRFLKFYLKTMNFRLILYKKNKLIG